MSHCIVLHVIVVSDSGANAFFTLISHLFQKEIRRYLWIFKLYWMAVNNMQLPLPRLMVRIRFFFFFFSSSCIAKDRKISRIHTLKHIFPKYSQYLVKRFTKIVQKNQWSGSTLLVYIQMSDIQNLANFKYGSIHIWQLCVFISLRKHITWQHW